MSRWPSRSPTSWTSFTCGMSRVASASGRWDLSSSRVWATLRGACLALMAFLMLLMCLLRSYISCRFKEKWACNLLCTSLHSAILKVSFSGNIRKDGSGSPGGERLVGCVPRFQHRVRRTGEVVLYLVIIIMFFVLITIMPILKRAESEKPCQRISNAERKVFANPESFCDMLIIG